MSKKMEASSRSGISSPLNVVDAGVKCLNPRISASSSSTTFHFKKVCGNQDVHASHSSDILSDLLSPSNHCEASHGIACEAYTQGPPNPSSKVMELIIQWRDTRCQLQSRAVYLNKKKCEHLPRWLISAEESYHANIRASAAIEFCAAVAQAKSLVEECSHNEWLLKAVELWECTEHFVEVLLDLCWSAYIMSLGMGDIERSQTWMDIVDKLLNSRSKRSDELDRDNRKDLDDMESCATWTDKTLGVDVLDRDNTIDKKDLQEMVCAKLTDKALEKDGPEHQLAHLLHDRLNEQSMSWRPPFLKRHRFHIYGSFVVPLKSSRKAGGHGTILKFPWVYGKEFAMKMRHPKEDSYVTFKREFEILDKCRSPFIVGVVGYWEAEAASPWPSLLSKFGISSCGVSLYPFLLMENLEYNLKDLMDRCRSARRERMSGGFSVLETIKLMLPIAKALRYLHGKDVAHRDVKPENIMCRNMNVSEDPEDSTVKQDSIVKLIDFGEATENVSDLSCDQWRPAGTTGYMDPSMWKPDAVGYTLLMGDVFSFAMVFAELLTWKSPFEAFGVPYSRHAQAKLKAGERPPLPPGLPNYVRFIVESCWCADPLKRPDFKAVCSMLQHARILLSDKEFVDEIDEIFSYEDATGGCCCISDGT